MQLIRANLGLPFRRPKVRRPVNIAKQTGDWEEHRKEMITYNKEVRKAKRASFRSFCVHVATTPEVARLHKALSRQRADFKMALRKQDGTYMVNEKEHSLLL